MLQTVYEFFGIIGVPGTGCPDEMNVEQYGRLRALAEADRDGRCVVLPCKVGDTVYRTFYVEGREPVIVDVKMHNLLDIIHFLPLFGKTVFLTRAEAEAKLAGEEQK